MVDRNPNTSGSCGCRCVRFAALAAVALLSACALRAPQPGFEAELPAAIPADVASIAVVGDLQMTPGLVRRLRGREDNYEPQQRLMADLAERVDEFGALAIVGDLVFNARSGRDWRHFDSLIAPIASQRPVLPAIGNHDYHCVFVQLCWQTVVPRRFRARFPWVRPGEPFVVPWGRVALVFLDSETRIDRQAAWLSDRFAAMRETYAAALLFFHRPPFSNSIDRGAHGDEDIQRRIVPVLEAAPFVSVVFNGHVHGYEHIVVDGIHYFTTAGGGGPRGVLGSERPGDVYRGRDCRSDDSGTVLRPFNYALVSHAKDALRIDVHGFCRQDRKIGVLESVLIPIGPR